MSEIKAENLTQVLSKMLGTKIISINFQAKLLQGGSVGNEQLVTGNAKCSISASSAIRLAISSPK